MILDMSDPAHPVEAGRWWLPGTREGDKEPAPERVSPLDSGFRLHTPIVVPEKPDRLYAGWIDGGTLLSDKLQSSVNGTVIRGAAVASSVVASKSQDEFGFSVFTRSRRSSRLR